MARRLRVVLVGAALAALVLGMAGAAWAQDRGCTGDIVLDPGHGGTDTGATYTFPQGPPYYGTKLTEAEQNLEVAFELKRLLVEDGYTVCMTRTRDDETRSNRARYTYANTTGAKLLLSIHMNGSTNSSVDYTTTLYGKPRKDLELAQSVFNSLSLLPPAKPNDPDNLLDSRPPYQFASGVLLKSNMPATIAETVFITNPYEAAWLADTSGERQQQIAVALEQGINHYLTN
jgi:N-acetylmuramoyl-L-alanine amidase